MKRTLFYSRLLRQPAFTLIELLVVIAIIAILAAVTATVGNTVIKEAKKAKAANTATQIQTAALGYYTEYSVYPVPSTVASGTDYSIADSGPTAQTAWGNLICVLCGNIEPYSPSTTFTATTITNSRGIAFLTLKASDVDSGNAPLNPLPTVVSATQTNNAYFNIDINSSYSGVLGTNSTTYMPNFGTPFNATQGGTSTAGVAVWANCNGSLSQTNAGWFVHTY